MSFHSFIKNASKLRLDRRGSVLILCVVLIVVLALMGTALLSTARIDRYTAAQNATNVQIDMLVEGAKQIAKSAITNDLYDTGVAAGTAPRYRAPTESHVNWTTDTNTYDPWDGYTIINAAGTVPAQNDTWIASLAPKIVTDFSAGAAPASAPYWDVITGALIGGTFENPIDGPPTTPVTEHTHMVPTIQTISGKAYPAMLHIDTGGGLEGPDGTANRQWLAGDADGDGIADSLFSRMVELNGVTYYIATRIVDNAAKVNLNTARSSTADYDFAANARVSMFGTTALTDAEFAGNLGAFKAHIGAQEMLRREDPTLAAHDPVNQSTFAEMHVLNEDRFGYSRGAAMLVVAGQGPIDDTGTPRTDFMYVNQGDAMDHGLGERLENPGINSSAAPAVGPYRAYGVSDAAALAYHGGMLNPSASYSKVEQTIFDAYLSGGSINDPDSLVRSSPNYPGLTPAFPASGRASFDPSNVGAWFDSLFNFDRAVGTFTATGLPTGPFTNELRLDTAGIPPPAYEPYYRTLRPLVTTWNPISQQIAVRSTGATLPPTLPHPDMLAYRAAPPKTSVNSATFGELFRAYWCVMREETDSKTPFTDASGTPVLDPPPSATQPGPSFYGGMEFDPDFSQTETPTDATRQHPARMFKQVIRDPRMITPGGNANTYLSYEQMVVLRAAIAAANTMAMRKNPAVTATTFYDVGLGVNVNDAGTTTPVVARIFPVQPQLFLTEVYVNTEKWVGEGGPTPPNPQGYIAIELYNPTASTISFAGAHIGFIDRPSTGVNYPLTVSNVHSFPAATAIDVPPGGYLLIENFDATGASSGPDQAVYRPSSSRLPVNGPITHTTMNPLVTAFVPQLHLVLNHEMVITFGGGDVEDATGMPVDSFDFTGIELPASGDALATVVHYSRPTDAARAWQWVYPGRYVGEFALRRQQGTQLATWIPNSGAMDPWVPGTVPAAVDVTLGMREGAEWTNENTIATYTNTFPIQWGTPDQAGPNPATGAGNLFPFGGFMRDGDILQVPFIASYRIYGPGPTPQLFEMNSLSMDAAFAEDTDVLDDPPIGDTGAAPREQVGRFCPINGNAAVTGAPDDHADDPLLHRYAWAKDLFDYLTVETPSFDFMPDVNPDPVALYTPPPEAVENGTGTAATFAAPGTEDTLAVHGKININTAPWPVLAAIPWVQGSVGTTDNYTYNEATGVFDTAAGNGIDDNIDVAKAIVAWRDGNPASATGTVPANPANGPFRSIFDLYRVVDRSAAPGINVFRAIQQAIGTAGEPGDAQGDFSPYAGAVPAPPTPTDGVRHDFEEQYLLLTRVSNLITTRSDSYTVYILLQGWRGVGTPQPEVVVQRRVAFILDRSPVTNVSNQPNTIKVVND